jgi:hypothetical protein
LPVKTGANQVENRRDPADDGIFGPHPETKGFETAMVSSLRANDAG